MITQIITIILIAIVLGVDAMSLSMGIGLRGVTRFYERKFSIVVGIFHVIMPLIGLNLGIAAGKFLGIWAGRIGAVLLAYIGIDMIFKAYRNLRGQSYSFSEARGLFELPSPSERWGDLLLLATTVSIDALTVGFSLGTVQMPVAYTVLIMGLVAGFMTYLGFRGGRLFGRLAGNYAGIFGGIVLIALAIKMAFY